MIVTKSYKLITQKLVIGKGQDYLEETILGKIRQTKMLLSIVHFI